MLRNNKASQHDANSRGVPNAPATGPRSEIRGVTEDDLAQAHLLYNQLRKRKEIDQSLGQHHPNNSEAGGEKNKKQRATLEFNTEALMCPITLELMAKPVIFGDGFSYDESSIKRFLIDHALRRDEEEDDHWPLKSPLHNKVVRLGNYYHNAALSSSQSLCARTGDKLVDPVYFTYDMKTYNREALQSYVNEERQRAKTYYYCVTPFVQATNTRQGVWMIPNLTLAKFLGLNCSDLPAEKVPCISIRWENEPPKPPFVRRDCVTATQKFVSHLCHLPLDLSEAKAFRRKQHLDGIMKKMNTECTVVPPDVMGRTMLAISYISFANMTLNGNLNNVVFYKCDFEGATFAGDFNNCQFNFCQMEDCFFKGQMHSAADAVRLSSMRHQSDDNNDDDHNTQCGGLSLATTSAASSEDEFVEEEEENLYNKMLIDQRTTFHGSTMTTLTVTRDMMMHKRRGTRVLHTTHDIMAELERRGTHVQYIALVSLSGRPTMKRPFIIQH